MHPWKALLVGQYQSNSSDSGESDDKNETKEDSFRAEIDYYDDQICVNIRKDEIEEEEEESTRL